MSEHHPAPGDPGITEPAAPDDTAAEATAAEATDNADNADNADDAAEAELIRKVLRTQERHREGGVDPELDEAAGPEHPGG